MASQTEILSVLPDQRSAAIDKQQIAKLLNETDTSNYGRRLAQLMVDKLVDYWIDEEWNYGRRFYWKL